MFGLIMIKNYLNEILDGSKTFDARSYPTNKRGKIALIDSGSMKIYGTLFSLFWINLFAFTIIIFNSK